MAEGWARNYFSERFNFFSAGVETHGMNPYAVRAMGEAGVDISNQHSKHVSEINADLDLVITVCDNARESCPVFSGNARVEHHSFEDPPKLAEDAETDEERMVHYRRVRDEIEEFVRNGLVPLINEE
jgi:arsenate reductase